jgi:hypothetical protein
VNQETSGIRKSDFGLSPGAGVARENIKIFTTETFSEVAPDAFLTLLFSKYAGRRHGNAAGTCSKETIQHIVN